jgi:hypothetical protein
MKAGQLARILQCVVPETEVYFSVGYDSEDRKNLLDMVGGDPDIMSELVATDADICEIRKDKVRIDVSLFPYGHTPSDINRWKNGGGE